MGLRVGRLLGCKIRKERFKREEERERERGGARGRSRGAGSEINKRGSFSFKQTSIALIDKHTYMVDMIVYNYLTRNNNVRKAHTQEKLMVHVSFFI